MASYFGVKSNGRIILKFKLQTEPAPYETNEDLNAASHMQRSPTENLSLLSALEDERYS
jgi:hypothetical protein